MNAYPHLTNLKNMVSFKDGFLAWSDDLTIHANDRSGVRRHKRKPMSAGVLETDRPGGNPRQIRK